MESELNECRYIREIREEETIKKIQNCKLPMFASRDRDNIYVDKYYFYIDDHFYMASSDCYGSQIFPSISYYEITIDYFEKEFEKFKEDYKNSRNIEIKRQMLNTTNFLNKNKEKFDLRKLEDKEKKTKNKIESIENEINKLNEVIENAPTKLLNYNIELNEAKKELEDIENKKVMKMIKK